MSNHVQPHTDDMADLTEVHGQFTDRVNDMAITLQDKSYAIGRARGLAEGNAARTRDRLNVTKPHSDYSDIEGITAFRWGGAAAPGKWLAAISFDGMLHCHVHLNCVVDDYGWLVPVDIAGITATEILNFGGGRQWA